MNRTVLILAATVFSLTAASAGAQSGNQNASSANIQLAQAAAPMAEGEVRKVDMDAKKITIRHGAIQNLGMPPMTMVFQVRDPALLTKAKAGDKIRFSAEKTGGAITVTQIEAMQ